MLGSVGILSFKADYGTKLELVVFDSQYYKAESIEYSTDLVNKKFGYVKVHQIYLMQATLQMLHQVQHTHTQLQMA